MASSPSSGTSSFKNEQDHQQSPSIIRSLQDLGLEFDSEGYVRWNRHTLDHPRNWSSIRKTYDTTLLLWFDCFTTAISTAGPAAARLSQSEYGSGHVVSLVAFTLMYQLGQAIGGVVFPPYSESFGRKSVYIFSAFAYSGFCIVTGVVPWVGGVYLGRFGCGVMSAVPSIVVEGSIEDMFGLRKRGWMIWFWACATSGGLFLGPIFGAFVSEYAGWRWIFHIAAIATALTGILIVFTRESRPSHLLSKRLRKLQLEHGSSSNLRIRNPEQIPDFNTFIKTNLLRPIQLFFTEPIVLMITIMSSVSWALIYLFTQTLPITYQTFNFTTTQTSLSFIPLLLGLLFGLIPRSLDAKRLRLRAESQKPLRPEDKLLGLILGAPALAIGLWWLAWTTPPAVTNLHWIVSMLGLIPIGFAINETACVLSGYLADSYTIYSASAFAALAFVRALCAGAFPLFGEQMFDGLGPNVANSVLAAVATLFCVFPFVLIRYGRGIRKRSAFARYSLEVHMQTGVDDDLLE